MKHHNLKINQAINHKVVILVGIGALMCVIFTAFTPPAFSITSVPSVIERTNLSPERVTYWWRFILSLLCMGIIPFTVAKIMGLSNRELGLTSGTAMLKKPLFLIALPVACIIGALGATSAQLSAYYPYATDLIQIIRADGMLHLAGHLGAYFFFYYLPWEFFFRGFMLFPFVFAAETVRSALPNESSARQSATLLLAFAVLFQTIPSTMLHFGHPLSELLSAIPAGILFGYLAYKSGSIIPPLLLHALVGFGTDTVITLHALGVL